MNAEERGHAPGPSREGPLALAWGVHALTASGAVVALLTLLAISAHDWRSATLWMLVAFTIDSVDGTLARRVGVAERIPAVDGRRLDDIVDYLNYVLVPVVFMLELGVLPHWAVAAFPLIASAYGFSQAEAKSADHYFVGFPSYWNVVALYAWMLEVTPIVTSIWVIGFAIAVFVPVRYLYPSRMSAWRRTMVGGAVAWMSLVAILVAFPDLPARTTLAWASLAYPALYVGASFWLGGGLQR